MTSSMSSMSSHHSSNQYVRRAPASYLRAHPSTWKDCPAPRLSRVTAAPSSLAAYRERSASRSYSRERREVDVVTMRERTPYSSVQAGGRSPRDRSWDPRGSRSPLEALRFVFPRQSSEGGRGYGTRLEVEKEKGGLKRQERVEVTPAASPALVKMREMIASLSMEGEDEEEEGDYESEEEVSIAVPILANVPKRRLSEPVVAPLAPDEEEDEEEWDEDEEEEEEEEEEEDEEENEEEPVIPTQTLVLKPPPAPLPVRLIPKIAPVVPPKPTVKLIPATPEVEKNEEEESEEEQSISLTLPNIWNQFMHVSSSLPCKLVELDDEEDEEDEDEDEEEDEEEGEVAFNLDSEEDEEEEDEEEEPPSGSKSLSEILFGVDPADRRVLLRLLEGESSLISKEQVREIRSQLEKAGLVIDEEEEDEVELSPELVLPSKAALIQESEEEDEEWEEEEEDAPSTSGVCEDEDEEEWEEGDEELMEYGEEWMKPGFQSSTGAPPSGIGRSPSIGSTPTNRDGLSTTVSRVAPRVASSAVTSGGTTDRSTAQFAAPTISSTAAANVNYRLLYEKERTENDKLRRELERSGAPPPEMNGSSSSTGLSSTRRLPTRLTSSQSVVGGLSKSPSGGSMEDAERRTLERRITELELELKEVRQLHRSNDKLKRENEALVRVLAKLARPDSR